MKDLLKPHFQDAEFFLERAAMAVRLAASYRDKPTVDFLMSKALRDIDLASSDALVILEKVRES